MSFVTGASRLFSGLFVVSQKGNLVFVTLSQLPFERVAWCIALEHVTYDVCVCGVCELCLPMLRFSFLVISKP